jgi:hypothetical protein
MGLRRDVIGPNPPPPPPPPPKNNGKGKGAKKAPSKVIAKKVVPEGSVVSLVA